MTSFSHRDYCLSGRFLARTVIHRAQLEASGDFVMCRDGDTPESIRRDAKEWLTRTPADHSAISEDIVHNCIGYYVRVKCTCGVTLTGREHEIDDMVDDHARGIEVIWKMAEMPVELDEFVSQMRRQYGSGSGN